MNTMLPDKLSDLIEVGLADLAKIEADPTHYVVEMNDWHAPWTNYSDSADPDHKMCNVCFAGAVMAFSLEAPIHQWAGPASFDDNTKDKLRALNFARQGFVDVALEQLGYREPTWVNSCWSFRQNHVCEYGDDKARFRADLEKIVVKLREAGL